MVVASPFWVLCYMAQVTRSLVQAWGTGTRDLGTGLVTQRDHQGLPTPSGTFHH